jgi:hypothetical protein
MLCFWIDRQSGLVQCCKLWRMSSDLTKPSHLCSKRTQTIELLLQVLNWFTRRFWHVYYTDIAVISIKYTDGLTPTLTLMDIARLRLESNNAYRT